MLSENDSDLVLDVVTAVMRSLSQQHKVLFRLSPKLSLGTGTTRRFDYSKQSDFTLFKSSIDSENSLVIYENSDYPDYIVNVGSHELTPLSNKLLSSDKAMAMMLISLMHEMRHVYQYDAARGSLDSAFSMNACVLPSLVVSCSNRNYYRANYHGGMVHEIDAEQYGICETYSFLSKLIGSDRANSSMLFALNKSDWNHIGPVQYNGHIRDFDSNQVQVYLDNCLIDSLKTKRDIQCLLSDYGDDFAASYFERNPGDAEVFKSLQYGYEQDAYLAMISLKYHPEDRKFFDIDIIKYPENIPIPNGISPVRGVNATYDLLPELVSDDIIMDKDDIEFDNFDL